MTAVTETIAALRQKLQQRPRDWDVVSTGVPSLDRLLPGGLRRGSLVEFLGHGAPLAFATARSSCQSAPLIVLDRQRQFYAPAWGIEPAQVVLLRPANDADELWACDQALRCPGVGAVVMQCGRLDQRDFRRMQLASETGDTLGLLLRPAELRGRPTWADVQWLVEPQPSRDRWRLRVELLRCRGTTGGSCVILELAKTNTWQEVGHAGALRQPSELVNPTTRRQSRA